MFKAKFRRRLEKIEVMIPKPKTKAERAKVRLKKKPKILW